MKIIKPNFWRINKSFHIYFHINNNLYLIIYLKRKYTKKLNLICQYHWLYMSVEQNTAVNILAQKSDSKKTVYN